jgi:SAM-dependent methyltransferase
MSDLGPTLDTLLAGEADPVFARRVRTVLAWLPPDRDPRRLYVDVGCGRGYYLHYYAALGHARIVGLERDPRIAALARAALADVPGAQVAIGSATSLPFADASVAGVVMSEVLEHVDDDAWALREAARVLRPGGMVALTVPHDRYPWLWDPINRTRERLGVAPVREGALAGIWAGHLRLYSERQLAALAAQAGFDVVETRRFGRLSWPFAHNLIYGVGKPLLESGRVPVSLARAVDRRGGESASRVSAWRTLRAAFLWPDRFNRDDEGPDVATVNLAMRLVRR